jgi:WD40 repeat protein
MSVSPAETFAVLIGIEQYAGGWPPLDGPANDAARFAQWLCSRGVPPQNILALVSMFRDRRQYAFPAGCRVSRATTPAISHVIKHVLPSLDRKGLFFQWGGHGIVDDDRMRNLFLSDATESLLEAVEVPALLRFLRSTRIKALDQQWFVIDACANRFRTASTASALAPLGLPVLRDARRHSQYVMFAASVGETAANLPTQREGLFSGRVLEALSLAPRDEWPPNMMKVAERVDEGFAARPSGQRPEYWWHRMGDREPTFYGSLSSTPPTLSPPLPPAHAAERPSTDVAGKANAGAGVSGLSASELDVLFDLAILRDAASPADLARLVLQGDVLAVITDRVVRTACDELTSGVIQCLGRRSLLHLRSYEFVQHEQQSRLLEPVARALDVAAPAGAVTRLRALIDAHRGSDARALTANLVNLFATRQRDLTGLDLSGADLSDADFRTVTARDLDLRGCNLADAAFRDAFTSMLAAAFSPDGQLVAAANADGIVRVWNIHTGRQLLAMRGHTDWCWAVAFHPAERLLASSGDDRTIRLWDLDTGTARHVLSGHEDWVRALAFSPDGQLLASGSQDAALCVWDVASGRLVRELVGHQDQIWSVAFNPISRVLASASGDGTVALWDVAATSPILRLEADGGRVFSVAFSADGEWLATGGDSREVRVWHAHTGQQRARLSGHERRVWRAVFEGNRTIVSSSEDGTVRLWDLDSGDSRILQRHPDFVRSVAHHPTEPWVAAASDDHSLTIVSSRDGRTIRSWTGWGEPLYAVTFAPDGKSLFTGGREQVSRWQLDDLTHGERVAVHESRVWAVAVAGRTRLGASGGDDEKLRLWSIDGHGQVAALEGHGKPLWSVAFAPDGELVASGSEDRTARIWSVTSLEQVAVCAGHTSWVRAATFAPDGSMLATGSDDRTVRLWTLDARPLAPPLTGHTGRVWTVAFHPTEQLLASGGDDGIVRIWDLHRRDERIDLAGHAARIWSVAFSPGGEYLASGSTDGTVRVWDVDRRRIVHVLRGHSRWVRSVAFSKDGTLASASEDGTVRVWTLAPRVSSRVLSPPRPYDGMRIDGACGLTDHQRETLVLLGAVDEETPAG